MLQEEDDDDRAQIVKLRKVACSVLNISGTCTDTSGVFFTQQPCAESSLRFLSPRTSSISTPKLNCLHCSAAKANSHMPFFFTLVLMVWVGNSSQQWQDWFFICIHYSPNPPFYPLSPVFSFATSFLLPWSSSSITLWSEVAIGTSRGKHCWDKRETDSSCSCLFHTFNGARRAHWHAPTHSV